jgi:hypothetical protein
VLVWPQIGARWIDAFIGSRLEIHGLERIASASRERPLLLAPIIAASSTCMS